MPAQAVARHRMTTLRDEAIVDLVALLGAMTTGQIERALFAGRYSRRTAQRRLRALREARRLTAVGHRAMGDFVWTPAKRRYGDLEHRIAVSQVYCDLGCPHEWTGEFVLGQLRADALFWLAGRPWLLEVERSHNDLGRKLEAYRNVWQGREWRDLFAEFPRILLVVPSPAHIARAEALPSPPKVVCTPGAVRRGVYG